MKNILFTILWLAFSASALFAQNPQKPCSSAEAKQFDFWVGSWDLEWTDAKGNKASGTNIVNKILGDCVIEENFSTGGQTPFMGKSNSLFDAASGKWKQTWVDNGGSYLDFVGEFAGGKMTLWREIVGKDGKKLKQRMIFYNITENALDWNWESSDDGGKNWKVLWKINYRRRK